jgi:hypothetical protein
VSVLGTECQLPSLTPPCHQTVLLYSFLQPLRPIQSPHSINLRSLNENLLSLADGVDAIIRIRHIVENVFNLSTIARHSLSVASCIVHGRTARHDADADIKLAQGVDQRVSKCRAWKVVVHRKRHVVCCSKQGGIKW